MGRSKNDVPCGGGLARIKTVREDDGRYFAKVALINMRTHKPYRYGELIRDLRVRAQEYPELRNAYARAIVAMEARCAEHPDKEVWSGVKGPDSQTAEERRQAEVWPRLEAISKLVNRAYVYSRTRAGTITIADYVQYHGDTLFTGLNDRAAQQCHSLTQRIILPQIGKEPVASLCDPAKRSAIMAAVNKKLRASNLHETQCGYTRRAMTCLLQHLTAAGLRLGADPHMVTAEIGRHSAYLSPMYQALTPNHLDASSRERMFQSLADQLDDPAVLALAVWIGLVYSGLTYAEIACLTLGDIRRVTMARGDVYIILITRIKRKNESRYSEVSAANDRYNIHRVRICAVVQWAAILLDMFVQYLREQHCHYLSAVSIASDPDSPYRTYDPGEMVDKVTDFLRGCPIPASRAIHRDRVTGATKVDKQQPDADLLLEDAQYVARQLCCLDEVALHNTFGLARDTVDERDYLYQLSIRYAVQRYVRLCRYCPAAFASTQPTPRYTWSETWTNTSDETQTLDLHAPYGTAYVIQAPVPGGQNDSYSEGRDHP